MMKFLEKYVLPGATKLGNQRHLLAVRDTLIGMLAITMVGAFAVLINNLGQAIKPYDRMMLSLFGENYRQLGGDIWFGTLGFMTIFTVVGIAYKLARSYGDDGFEAMLVSLSCFFVISPSVATITLKIASKDVTGTSGDFVGLSYFNSTALFTGIIISLLATEVFVRLAKVKYLVVKLPEGVPPAVSRSFARLFPGMITIFLFALASLLFRMVSDGQYFHDWINKVLISPLTNSADSLPFALVLALLIHLFWALGLHGPNILGGITTPLFTKLGNDNIDLYAKGVTDLKQYAVMAGQFFDAFVFLGGSGATIGLLIALWIASKKRKQMVALGMPPGIFQINEPVLFGMPIVLNPIWLFPFIATPIILTVISYLAIDWGFVYPVVTTIPWVTPPVFGGYLATGAHVSGAVLAAINLVISVVIYLPFVLIQERMDQKRLNEVKDDANVTHSM
ncbi:PTS sugar transporter subunit IIC [Bacillus massiliigorillae]|uniref:PTS sugar transporter subunit IIC n=1 Tax=Bacillus massiliigorillae TaxID=1243664 RepID=UPI0003AA31CF|nr:PTS transporter subunit EIIC [Bacillus massiliigorillae]